MHLIAQKSGLKGSFWDFINQQNERFNSIGFYIILFFIMSWIVSIFIYKLMNFEALERQVVDEKKSKIIWK